MIFSEHDIPRIWSGLEQLEEHLRRVSQPWSSSPHREYDSMSRPVGRNQSVFFTLPIARVQRVRDALRQSAHIAKDHLTTMLAGIELESIWGILLAIVEDMALYWGGSVLAGTVVGGAMGFLGFGAGALPGAVIGAAAGNEVGLWVLAFLGLKALAVSLVSAAVDAAKCYQKGFKWAWGPTEQNQFGFSGTTSDACVAHGAHEIAQGHVIMVLAILTALVAYLTMGRGVSKAAALAEISANKRLGPKIAQWLEKNEEQLAKHPQLQPRQPSPAGGSGRPHEEAPAPRPREATEPAAKEIPSPVMAKKKLPCFKASNLPQGSVPEFDRQLMGQEGGINDMTVKEYLKGREAFDGGETVRDRKVARDARVDYQKELSETLTKQLRAEGINLKQAEQKAAQMAADQMKTLAALHNPDLAAAGKDVIADFGDALVNSTIGGQWKSGKTSKLDALDGAAQAVPENMRASAKMNVKLERCK